MKKTATYLHQKGSLREAGIAHILILLAAIGLIIFLLISNNASFKDRLFGGLFPKSPSLAANVPGVTIVDASGNVLTQTTSPTVRVQLAPPWSVSSASKDSSPVVAGISLVKEAFAQTSTTPIVLEAENMSLPSGAVQVYSDSAASGGKGLLFYSNSTATAAVTTTGLTNNIIVRAKADKCQGNPSMTVSVDGQNVLRVAVSATSFADYPVTTSIASGNHTVGVSFTNDLSRKNCDRNLKVDKITLNQVASGTNLSPPPTPTSTPTTAPSASPTPSPTIAMAAIAEDSGFTQNVVNIMPFTADPTFVNYTFSNSTLGTKTLYAKFTSNTGQTQTFNTSVQLVAISPSPSPSAPTSGTIWGAVDAAVLGECSAAAHDKYVVDGGDGFLYRIWHPQADPSGCVFAHEHGDDPKIMTDTWVRDNWDPRFGYAARRMTSTAEPNGHAEAHEGYKVFVANLGDVNDEGRKNLTPTLSYFHMGTGGPKRFTVQHHSNSIAYRYQTGTPYAATHLMLDTGGVSDACDPRAQAPTKDGMLLQNRCKLNSPYEIWGTAQTIKSGSRQIYQGFATPAVFDPITVFNRDNPTEVVYAWDPRVAAIKNFNDDWSGHRGCKRESYAQVGYFYNGGGPTTYYTDPMGNVVTQGTAGAIKQTLSASNAVGVLSTDDGLFQYKKATNYCQQIGKLGLKN